MREVSELLTATLEAGKKWRNVFKFLRVNNSQPKIVYPGKLSVKCKRRLKSFSHAKPYNLIRILSWEAFSGVALLK